MTPEFSKLYRTHNCGQLNAEHVGQEVKLSGWIHSKRDHGGLLFIDLRDHFGLTQLVISSDHLDALQKVRIESVIQVSGKVIGRGEGLANPKISTGEIEIEVTSFEVLSNASVLPFQIAEDDNAPEAMRLKSRFLELRREKLHNNILLRSKVAQATRRIMTEMGFLEVHTPILTSSSPEGARDFIVPSRVHPGRFFALPQAPQQFKQLLMVSGFDKYFQIAPCFRDEDARADRSPGEFYQIDMEMSFCDQEDVFAVTENLMWTLFTEFSDFPMSDKPFQRLTYKDSVARYGSDKPDLRNPLEIKDVSSVFEGTEFKVFNQVLADKGSIQVIAVPLDEAPSRKYFDDTISWFKNEAKQGLAWMIAEDGVFRGSISKFFAESELSKLKDYISLASGTYALFFVAGATKQILPWCGRLRNKLGTDFSLGNKDEWKFCWITDYPMYELNEDTGKVEFSHNPFSMPQGGIKDLEEKDPLDIYAYQYDIVCNGYEIASGAIRNHKPEIMYKAFEIAGYPKEEVERQFGGMLNAFQYGAPPHGGIAPGFERIVMLLAGEEAIRDIIAFPLSQNCEDLMMKAPSDVSESQLKDVHIALDLPEEPQI